MQSAYFKKLITFCVLILVFMNTSPAAAQNVDLSNLSNSEIFDRLQLPETDANFISTNDFVANITRNPLVPANKYTEAVESIRNMPALSGGNADNLIGALMNPEGGATGDVRIPGYITNLAEDLTNFNFPSDVVDNVLGNLGKGLTAQTAQTITNLGLSNLPSHPDLFSGINTIIDELEAIQGLDPSELMNGLVREAVYGTIFGDAKNAVDQIKSTIENFKEKIPDPKVIEDLLKKVADGKIPTEIADAFSGALDDFDALKDLDGKALLEKLGISDQLEGLKEDAEKLLEAVAGVGEIMKIAKELENIDVAGLFSNLSDTVKAALIAEFGDEAAVIAALAELLGGDSGPSEEECGAECSSCDDCGVPINTNHIRIRSHVTSQFEQHRTWIVTEFFVKHIAPAMAKMNSQLITVGTQQIQAIGQFFDAKHQLETQRLFQTMTARAHKDYHPSEGLCKIGTSSVSLAGSQRISDLSQGVMAEQMMNRQLATADTMAGGGRDRDRRSRLNLFIENFCNKTDHGGGLQKLCKNSTPDPAQINMDVDYTNAFNNKLTLQFDPLDTGDEPITKDEQNLYGLSSNLFANQILPTFSESELVKNGEPTYKVQNLLDMRSVAAKRSVAINSFTAIAAQKAEGDEQAAPFLKAVLAETGVSPQDIENRLGKRPSYYAQMEVLTKDIYQSPEFYANLYDKPANVNRKAVALLALELMQDRDIYDSLLRSEAVLATMIELLIRDEHTRVTENLGLVGTTGPAYRGPTTAPTEPVVGPQ